MVVFPPCKINLGLHVTAKRADGFHNIETIFYPVALCDGLEIVASTDQFNHIELSGISLPGNATDNLCLKAWQLLKNDYPDLPHIRLHLHKAIPIGAGLGGGSADAAFTLALLNKLFKLDIKQERLLAYALQLGSDCPFFFVNKIVLASGRGEVMQPLTRSLKGYYLVIINPGIHISTAAAFSAITPGPSTVSIEKIIAEDVLKWRHQLVNDFEAPMCARYPEIGQITQLLYAHDALYAAMSGSGSTVFGIFDKPPVLPVMPAHYFIRSIPCEL